MPDFWGLAAITTKFALYLGVLTSIGTVLAAVLFQLTGYRRFTIGFAILGIMATLLSFSLAGATLTGDASGMVDPEMLELLWSTPVGTTVLLRLAGLGLLILGLVVGQIGLFLSITGGVLALWSFVNIGHIPDRDNVLLNLVLMFHLAAVSVWIGILSPLRAMSLDANRVADAADLGHRFGKVAAAFVPLLILAGVYMSIELVGSFSNLMNERYGQTLILKVLFVAGLLGLAAANKFRFIPAMVAGDQTAADHLARTISFEWVVVFVILMTTAFLTSVLTLPS